MRKILGFGFLIMIILFGCSESMDPTVPSNEKSSSLPGSMDGLSVIGLTELADGSFDATGLMGAYELRINPSSAEAELVSKRQPSLGESWTVSGAGFFTLAPCSDCLTIKSVAMTPENAIQLTFNIRHPFEPGNPAEPPTAKNRLDLDVFDLAMVVVPVGAIPDSYPHFGGQAFVRVLKNNAGYTTELANVIGKNAAMPYALVIDDSIIGISTNNRFMMGMESSFNVDFSLDSMSDLNFDLYLTMGYGASAKGKNQRLEPTYFTPEFNRKAAWKVEVIPPEGDNPPAIGNTWQDNNSATKFNVKVKIYDWQHGVTSIKNPPVNPGDIAYASNVSYVAIEIPGMNDSLQTVNVPAGGTITPVNPLVIEVPIANENYLEAGEYTGLVKVADTRIPKTMSPTSTFDYMIHSPDGVELVNRKIPEYTTYQAFTATVVMGCGPVTGSIISPSCPLMEAVNNTTIDFMVTAESAAGGDPIVLYEADWDYNGTTFHTDASSTNGVFMGGGPFLVSDPCLNNIPHTHKVAFRATDSCVPQHKTIFATCDVRVNVCTPSPVGNVTLTVNRQGVTQDFQINSTNPWTLSWSAAAGAVEYAVYYDTDPSDGLTNNLLYAGSNYTTHYDVPSSHLPSNRYILGTTYIVRSRGAIGNPASEAEDSQPAFITANGFDSLANLVNPGEGWVTNCQINSTLSLYRPRTTSQFQAYGSMSCQFPYSCGDTYGNRWAGMTKATPSIPNSTVRRLECSAYYYQTASPTGLIFGTSSTQPTYNWSTPANVEWASVSTGGAFTGYNVISSDAVSTFDGVPASIVNAWVNNGSNRRFLYGGNVNVDGNPSDPNVAIEFVMLGFGAQPYPFIDEITIAIY